MNIMIIGDPEDFDRALKKAREMSGAALNTNLNAVTDAGWIGRLDTVWDAIETALRKGYQLGKDLARDALDQAIAEAEKLLLEAGKKAKDLHEVLLKKLQEFVQGFITNALGRVPLLLALGGKDFNIQKVTCTQKLVITGSLKTNLTEVFSLASNGELEVAVDYALPIIATA